MLDPVEERKGVIIRSFLNWLDDKGYGLHERGKPEPLDIDERYDLVARWLDD